MINVSNINTINSEEDSNNWERARRELSQVLAMLYSLTWVELYGWSLCENLLSCMFIFFAISYMCIIFQNKKS